MRRTQGVLKLQYTHVGNAYIGSDFNLNQDRIDA